MMRNFLTAATTAAFLVVSAHSIHADVRTDQKTKVQLGGAIGKVVNMFGGKAARDGITQSVSVKGDRKATINDTTGQIIDLAEEKIYDLDLKKKTYKVTTFAEMRQRFEEGRKRAAAEAGKEQPADTKAQKDPNAKEYDVDFSVKNTGVTKAVNGFDTHETIVTITVREKGKTIEQSGGVIMTTDMWLANKVPAMTELQQFDMKYAQKLFGPMVTGASPQDMATAMAMYPQMKPALDKMRAEGGKIEGTPILTTTTMEAVQSAEQAAQAPAQSSSGSSAPPTIGGLLGGFGKKMAKKDEAKKDDAAAPAKPGQTTFLTSTLEMLKITNDVAADAVAIPAGFKEEK